MRTEQEVKDRIKKIMDKLETDGNNCDLIGASYMVQELEWVLGGPEPEINPDDQEGVLP